MVNVTFVTPVGLHAPIRAVTPRSSVFVQVFTLSRYAIDFGVGFVD